MSGDIRYVAQNQPATPNSSVSPAEKTVIKEGRIEIPSGSILKRTAKETKTFYDYFVWLYPLKNIKIAVHWKFKGDQILDLTTQEIRVAPSESDYRRNIYTYSKIREDNKIKRYLKHKYEGKTKLPHEVSFKDMEAKDKKRFVITLEEALLYIQDPQVKTMIQRAIKEIKGS